MRKTVVQSHFHRPLPPLYNYVPLISSQKSHLSDLRLSLWIHQVERLQRDLESLRRENAHWKKRALDAEMVNGYKTRRTYSKKAVREHGTHGRVVRDCKICKKRRVIHGRGMCEKCYMKWYHQKNLRRKPLGGMRLTRSERAKIRMSSKG